MIVIPEHYKPKRTTCREDGSTHSPVSVSHFWNTEKTSVPIIRPLVATERHVSFAPTVRVREFGITPPLSPLEETDVWYSKKDFSIFNAENKVLTKAIRLGSRTGNQKVRPEVPELRGLENFLSTRANLEAKGRHSRALTAVFIEQESQRSRNIKADPEAIREASLKVTRQSLDIALYRGKMDHQRCMMPSAARFGPNSPVTRKKASANDDFTDIAKPSLPRMEKHRPATSVDKEKHNLEQVPKQRPGIVSQSSLRFREAVKSNDKSPAPPKRSRLQAPRKPEIDTPSSFAVGKPRRGRIVVKP